MKMERSIYTVMICHGIPEVDSKGKEPKKVLQISLPRKNIGILHRYVVHI